MCGRFALDAPSKNLTHHFKLKQAVTLEPRYNIAPSQSVVIIRESANTQKLSTVRWGLIPHWAREEKIGYRLINARAETVAEKPSFRDAFRSRRCLIPATGFYEWKHEGRMKQPYFIQMKDGDLFAMAGIWETWQSPNGKTIESCAIITTEANTIVGQIHDRMPAILPVQNYNSWLTPQGNKKSFQDYLKPYPPSEMTAYQVSSMVNNIKNEGEECIRGIDNNE